MSKPMLKCIYLFLNNRAADILKYILEDMQMRSLIFNLEDIKTKIDADSKGPY